MSYYRIPVTSKPNQTMQCTLTIDGKNITLKLGFRYNEIAQYWTMTVTEPNSNKILLDSIPLITGKPRAENILAQHAYLGIGSAYVVKTGNVPYDIPLAEDLGANFDLVWGDTNG